MKKILLLLANGYETYEAGIFIDVFGWNLIDGDRSTQIFSCGLQKEINSSFNQKCIVDYLIEEVDVKDYDALAIPGGFEEYGYYTEAYDERFLNIIREFKKCNKIIAAICVAALPVGKSGILYGKKGTTYNKNAMRQETLRTYGVNVINQPIVLDDNIITCWNPSTGIDVSFMLLELLTSKHNANYIKNLMGFDEKIRI